MSTLHYASVIGAIIDANEELGHTLLSASASRCDRIQGQTLTRLLGVVRVAKLRSSLQI